MTQEQLLHRIKTHIYRAMFYELQVQGLQLDFLADTDIALDIELRTIARLSEKLT